MIHAGTDLSQELSDGQQIVQIVFFNKKRYVEFSVNVEDLKQRKRVGAIKPNKGGVTFSEVGGLGLGRRWGV